MGNVERKRRVVVATPVVAEGIEDPKSKRSKLPARRLNFNERNVLKLKVNDRQHFVWDAGTGAARGLAVLVQPTGTATFMCSYRFAGSPKLYYRSIGRVGAVTVEEARAKAIET